METRSRKRVDTPEHGRTVLHNSSDVLGTKHTDQDLNGINTIGENNDVSVQNFDSSVPTGATRVVAIKATPVLDPFLDALKLTPTGQSYLGKLKDILNCNKFKAANVDKMVAEIYADFPGTDIEVFCKPGMPKVSFLEAKKEEQTLVTRQRWVQIFAAWCEKPDGERLMVKRLMVKRLMSDDEKSDDEKSDDEEVKSTKKQSKGKNSHLSEEEIKFRKEKKAFLERNPGTHRVQFPFDNPLHPSSKELSVFSHACRNKERMSIVNNAIMYCLAGYETYTDLCLPCNAGQYQDTDLKCKSCDVNAQSSALSIGASNCKCNKGYTGDGLSCSACGFGTYKDIIGSTQCISCSQNSTTLIEAATSSIASVSQGSTARMATYASYAPRTTTSPREETGLAPLAQQTWYGMAYNPQTMGYDDCGCPMGYEGFTTSDCNPCKPGYYKDYDGFGSCTQCGTGLFTNDYGSIKCRCEDNKFEFEGVCYNPYPEFFDTFPRACAGNLVPLQGSTFGCVCMAGTVDFNGTCYCVANWYMDPNGECQMCPSNKASPAKSTSVNDCSCQQCEEGGQCVPCAYPCPANSHFDIKPYSIDDCLCDKGYYKDGLECKACGINSTTSFAGATDPSSCVCSPGNYRDSGVCKPCPLSFYKSLEGDGACTPCPTNTFTSAVGQVVCQCSDLKVGPGESFRVVALQELIIDTSDCYLVIDQHELIPGEWNSGTCEFYIQSLLSLDTNTLRGSNPFAIYSVGLVNITGDIRHLASASETRGAGYYAGFCYYGGSGGGFGGQGGFGSAPGGPVYGAKELWPWYAFQARRPTLGDMEEAVC
ncbi:hypothetical protein GUITHDRAFT_108949 [Guillardia theta CCMP2712]|uniref:Tyrosine-protein kinase ephrin type A/B receptor-like domain-containing protein n=1 Tax=Guillardia theta (strain CCMP2712) TaxID=905079 RepID=L1JB56_GUITC|nr:hypothetical protein GUITHDRAFT_108949 [Guillardia theta CCMP2712]EKX45310.1 hypothetical protein GUITHDRAFT_108949 [Guillardia theta CCMP2712]|eukprot:XP_005832290.1 hypothetical protein GUITHDRAFT_108949 [Guillardia theta CCMP2712]